MVKILPMKNVMVADNFWVTLYRIKAEKMPDRTWADICDRAGVNYSSFRSAKSVGSVPVASTINAFAKVFDVSPNYLINGKKDKLALRRRAVADCIMEIDESTFVLIERMLGLTPSES